MTDPGGKPVYYVYIAQCKYGTYYTGWTNDITNRMVEHNRGSGAKYLRGKSPVILVYKKKYRTARQAQARERWIKKLTREKKEALVISYKLGGV
jgi:putative endonuclease